MEITPSCLQSPIAPSNTSLSYMLHFRYQVAQGKLSKAKQRTGRRRRRNRERRNVADRIRKLRLLDHLFPYTRQAGSGDVDVQSLHVDGSVHDTCQLELGIAWWRVGFVIFEAVQVLVSFAAHLAAEWLFFLHADCARIGDRRFGIDDGKRAVCVLMKLLVCVTVLGMNQSSFRQGVNIKPTHRFVVLEPVLILVSFFASYHRTSERLDFFTGHHATGAFTDTDHHLLFADPLRQLAVRTVLPTSESKLCVLVRGVETTVRTKQSFGRFVNA